VALQDGSGLVGGPVPTGVSALRDRLRALPVLAGQFPGFDPADLPDDPVDLFAQWLGQAIEAGVAEPHAMTLATVGDTGAPSARVVILKDVRDGGWEFATHARTRKVRELAENPRAAAGFYWQPQGRQVRLSGPVIDRGALTSAADFISRSPGSRAAALAARPGEPLGSTAELEGALVEALRRVERQPSLVLDEWSLLALIPLGAEFWQGAPDRAHIRVVYRRDDISGPWRHDLVWP